MSTQNSGDAVAAAAADLREGMSGLTPEEQAEAKTMLGSIGDKWWLLLVLGIISLIVGLLIAFNPTAAVLTIAVFFGIWLLISGIFTLIRGFGDKLETGAKVFAIITGAISIILGILCFRNIANAVEILVLFFGIGMIMRGLLEFIIGLSAKGSEGRGGVIFIGIVTFIAGIAVLVWPNIGLGVLVYFIAFTLIIMGILEIIAAFRVKSVGTRIDQVLAQV